MELSNQEFVAVEQAIEDKRDADKRELDALELALIGGGCGDVHF